MGHEPNKIHIYSASWGPTDDGKTVDGPRNATMRAIVKGVNEVRRRLEETNFFDCCRAEMDLDRSSFGLLAMAVRMTTATATDTQLQCGPSPSTRPSTTERTPTTTSPAPPLWHRPSRTVAETRKLASRRPISMDAALGLILEPQPLLPKLLVSSLWLLRQTHSSPGVISST